MKPLDENKKYDLSQLNDEQLLLIIRFIKRDDNFNITEDGARIIKKHEIFYCNDDKEWCFRFITFKPEVTNALELFEEEPNGYEITVNKLGRVEPKYPNYSCDKENIYERSDKLMQDGKQQGLKIVVTFEKL